MSLFIQGTDGVLLRDRWGFPEATLASDNPAHLSTFPPSYEGVCHLLTICSKTNIIDKGHHTDIMADLGDNGSSSLAILRLQGFLKHTKIGTYGNWDGNSDNCMSAINAIHLEPGSGAFGAIWVDTWRAIDHVRRWYGAMTHAICADRVRISDMDSIRCSRRVFSRYRNESYIASGRGNQMLDAALTRVSHQWYPEVPALLGVRRSDGRVSHGHPAVFHDGDFVDIAISFDVVERPGNTFNLYLKLEHLVQLAAHDSLYSSVKAYLLLLLVTADMLTVYASHTWDPNSFYNHECTACNLGVRRRRGGGIPLKRSSLHYQSVPVIFTSQNEIRSISEKRL
ncbi:hypothetical protein CALCODRAFT_509367 [Calocera cornea HHB12733]|uniref:Uncharacterized protein n=1 Tax=Calocera cornea HHB12733 TaxID=1353952 RepID=A0A165FDP3_9BASI|nr:hypothetical protein CALCODRAFT_509367 [Calocera cornea HHB12733]